MNLTSRRKIKSKTHAGSTELGEHNRVGTVVAVYVTLGRVLCMW